MKRILKVNGMKCEKCKEAIEKALEKFDDIDVATADFASGHVSIESKEEFDLDKVKKAIEDLGYEVEDYEGVE